MIAVHTQIRMIHTTGCSSFSSLNFFASACTPGSLRSESRDSGSGRDAPAAPLSADEDGPPSPLPLYRQQGGGHAMCL